MERLKPTRPALVAAGVAVLLCVFLVQLTLSVRRGSITWDEDDHIYAGYMSWKHGDFGLNPEHPPLVKLLAALPLLRMPLKMPELQNRNFKIEAFLGGKDFLFQNDAEAILLRAHLGPSLLTLALVLLVFLAAREMFGPGAGFIALGFLVFDPNLLAHGAVVGTDAGLSCFMVASVYAFYRYLKIPSAGRLAVVGIATGLALASKHTGILVFPMLLLLAVGEVAWPHSSAQGTNTKHGPKRALQLALALVVVSAISIAILWAFYGFRYQARAAGVQINPPLAEAISSLSRPREIWLLSTVAHWRLLPESYIYGLADVRYMSDFYSSYLLGKAYPHGVWFYFPVAIAIKSTVPFLILCLVAAWAIATRKLQAWREIMFLTIPPAFYLLIAMGSGMNIGVRHILPMYMFLTVLVAGAAWTLVQKDGRWTYAIAGLLLFQVMTSTRAYPSYLAYANELWGGPSESYHLLNDSNVDWGQQLKATREYLDQRGVKDCWFAYFADGVVDTGYYGVPCKSLPTVVTLWVNQPTQPPPVIDGTVLISAGTLSGFEFGPGPLNPYEQFQHLRPTAVIQHGVFVFDGHFEVPLAASISHGQKARNLLDDRRPSEALSEAQQAVALAPEAVRSNAIMGDVLTALQRPEEARRYYQNALRLAQTVEPEFQAGWLGGLQRKLDSTSLVRVR